MKKILIPICFLSLGGCAEWHERIVAAQQAKAQAIADADDATCRGYGAQPGSDSYVMCRSNIANQRATAAQIDAINDSRNTAIIANSIMNR
jgi:hypothetical protein